MNLAVSTRISAGFAVVVIFLILIGFTGWVQVSKISDDIGLIVDEMEPMSRLAGDLKTNLLASNQYNYSVAQRMSEEEMAEHTNAINSNESEFFNQYSQLKMISANHDNLLAAMSELETLAQSFYESSKQVIEHQTTNLNMMNQIENAQFDLEELADDLDTEIFDLSDTTDTRALRTAMESINSLASDAVINSVDGLEVEDMQTVDIKMREMEAIVTTLKQRLQDAQSAARTSSDREALATITENFDDYFTAIDGNQSLLSQYKVQLAAKIARDAAVIRSGEIEDQAVEATNRLIQSLSNMTNETNEGAQDTVNFTYVVILLLSVISLVIAGGVAWWVVMSIRTPLASVNKVLQTISRGDLKNKIEITNDDEFGELSGLVNELVDSLKTIIENIKDNTHELTVAADETSKVTQEANHNISEQRAQTTHILDSMEQMTSAVEEVATSAHSTSDEVEKAHLETQSGLKIVNSNINSITSLASEIDKASEVINQLNDYSTNIGNILDVIRGIAEQTNLLALNAAIEAARAGEQGRGFAVVADEVRTLASRTQESTSEIQEMIERLQSGAVQAVEVMQGSRAKASSSVEDIQKAGELLQTITTAISTINDMSTDIATAAEEQASVADEVFNNANTISQLADKTSSGAESTLRSSERVSQLANELEASVNHFKV